MLKEISQFHSVNASFSGPMKQVQMQMKTAIGIVLMALPAFIWQRNEGYWVEKTNTMMVDNVTTKS